ncbi:MAG: NAD-dependent epimerase/dehydratase family protein [Tepidisphaeraceae bacterium]|jgi:nucleoside-diphosphate-sugar epimerase
MPNTLPQAISNVEELDELLSRPTSSAVETIRRISGDVVVLGVGGKMGPTLARMLRRAADAAGTPRRIIGVARFSNPELPKLLTACGVETIAADLLDPRQLTQLPEAPNVIYMPALKFGASGQAGRTWAINSFLPGLVCQRYPQARIVAFSTGNVYGLVPVDSGGSRESDELRPVGEYAMSCLGRERVFDYFSREAGTRVALERLYYATEMRYGVLRDIAEKVAKSEAVDVSMGHINCIWQGDANARTIQLLEHTQSPAYAVNVSGPWLLKVREVAEQFGELLGKRPVITGQEAGDALVCNATRSLELFGRPGVEIETLLRWTADWVRRGGESVNKPTHFEERGGKY